MKHPDIFLDNQQGKKITNKYFFGFIEGDFGEGKTLGQVWLSCYFKDNYHKIYSNFPTNIDGKSELIKRVDAETILNLTTSKHKKSLLLLQEADRYYGKRNCMKKDNKGIMDATFQIRKKRIDALVDIVRHKYLDSRCTDIGNFYMGALSNYEANPNIFEYVIKAFIGYRRGIAQFQDKFNFDVNALPFWDLYDTEYVTKTY